MQNTSLIINPQNNTSTFDEMTESNKLHAMLQLLSKLEDGEQSAREKGWLSANDVEAALGV